MTEQIVPLFVIYGFLLVVARVAGKRPLGQLTAFGLVVLLIISHDLQNAVIGSDHSLGGALLGATVIMALKFRVERLAFRHKSLERLDGHVSVVPRRPVPA